MLRGNKKTFGRDHAGVKIPPPLVYFVLSLFGAGIHSWFPLPLGLTREIPYWGLAIVSIPSMLIIFSVIWTFRKVETGLEPWSTTSAIVTSGPFRFSRNPIYLAFFIVPVAIGVKINSFWPLIMIVPIALIISHVAIKKEEAYLESKFGQIYLDYKSKVRRWL